MKLYIFNPEHDIALASNLEHFTAPHAGRELRHDLGFLPALWADDGDSVLVNDKEAAMENIHRLGLPTRGTLTESIKCASDRLRDAADIRPWGWDLALRHDLKAMGVPAGCLPANAQLNIIRQVSHRAWAAEHLLRPLRETADTVGEAEALHDIDEVRMFLSRYHDIVLKAPWSSSGRGIRYISYTDDGKALRYGMTSHLEGWIRNVIMRQGCVMAEPYYNKVVDFGMEFTSDGKGLVRYEGLSLFHTVNGAYTGNVVDDEDFKAAALSRLVPLSLLSTVRSRIVQLLSEEFRGVYAGPFGVDLMVVKTAEGLRVHPCVELNLRMTMGHVALLLNRKHGITGETMRIEYSNGRYGLRLMPIKSQP